jgi:hypothetical protein
MTDNQTPATFYLGDQLDAESFQRLNKLVFYRSSDLTTHGMILGMPSLSKTTLGLVLMEETILDGIPIIIIDPRGDAANLLLNFPDFKPESFKPWIPQGEARQANMNEDEYAKKVADTWRQGLTASGIKPETLQQFRESAQFSIYTPGSDSGIPINILALQRPPAGINQEMYLERVRAVVSNLLILAGIRNKTVMSIEHIFLSNLIDLSWRQGIDITLEQLVSQIPEPPITQLGHLELAQVFSGRERMKLAQQLNGLLASPEAAIWHRGDIVDIENFLYTADNRPKVSIFYLAHLDEETRTSIISVILEQLISWMHRQAGSQQLRMLVYIDEMYGYLPPQPHDPPTKQPFLYLLKEGRAFGLGLIMAASNPTDLDYRALSNAGTWFIGRLQMEQDRERLMEGLGAIEDARNPLSLDTLEQTIKTLPQSAFLLHNVHQSDAVPMVIQTRFPMSYVRGPLSLQEIQRLKPQQASVKPPPPPTLPEFSTYAPPAPAEPIAEISLPTGVVPSITQYFLPVMISFPQAMNIWAQQNGREVKTVPPTQPIVYYPLLIAQVQVRYYHASWKDGVQQVYAFHVYEVPPTGLVHWGEWRVRPINPTLIQENPMADASYAPLQNLNLDDSRLLTLEHNMLEYVHGQATITIPALSSLGLFALPHESFPAFQARALETARQQRDANFAALVEHYERKLIELQNSHAEIQSKLDKAYRELPHQQQAGINPLSLVKTGYFLIKRNYFFSILDILQSQQTSDEKRNQHSGLDDMFKTAQYAEFQSEVDQLYQEYHAEIDALNQKWTAATATFENFPLTVSRDNMSIEVFGLGWIPYYSTVFDNQSLLLPAL